MIKHVRLPTRRILLAIAAVVAFSGTVQAQQADLNGTWSNGTAPIRIHQDGRAVYFRYLTDDFDHRFQGRFVAPDTIEGQYAPRRNRHDGCTTTMDVTIQVVNSDNFVLRWHALDSNCDLRADQTGEDAPYSRQ